MAKGSRKGRLILIDAHSLIYRAFFALPPMSTASGEVTNAAYGFTSMLAIVLAARPEFAVAAFDVASPTFRSQEYAEYKQGRKPMPDDLRPQIERVREILTAFGIPIHALPGHEADDVVGTLARLGEEKGLQVTIVSGDLDCLQLVSDSVEALVPRRGITDTLTYGPDQVRQRYNLEPGQLIDYKALRGDTSDNIPGVPGVGEKTASQLIQQFGSVENLLANLDSLKEGRVKVALAENRERIALGKRLVTINRHVEVELDLEKARWTRYDDGAVRRLFDDLEFRALLSRFPPPDVVEIAPVQPTLAFEPTAPASGAVVVDGEESLLALVESLKGLDEAGVFGLWDASPRDSQIVGLGIASAAESWYLPLNHQPSIGGGANLPLEQLVAEVMPLLRGLELLGHDVKEMQLAFDGLVPHPYHWGFSSSLAAYLLGAGARDPRLEDLARDFLGVELLNSEQFLGTGRNARPPSATDPGDAANFAAARAQAIFNLRPRLAAEMRNLGVDYLFHEVELPLARVLASMEAEGVAIDSAYLGEMAVELNAQLAAIEVEVAAAAGEQRVNLNAPQQLAKFLFEDLKLPVGKRNKTGYSTDAETLEGLRDKHPVVPRILDHRQLSKLKSTYVDSLPLLVDGRDSRVHTSLGQAVTATGRLSSSNPNLMNIPIRTELGQRIRRAFVAGRPGAVIFSADYSQIELRIAAHLSQDPQLLGAFEAGQDIHAATAATVFKVPLEEVDAGQRRLAKIANFGSLYGQGEYGLSQQMGIPGEEAREFLKQYWTAYAHLKEWLDEVRNRAREEGVVISETGRRRSIPDLRSPNWQLRAAAERMAINFPIQSLAADIIKIAMVRVHREIEEQRLAGVMILQVHDELVFEIPEAETAAFADLVPRVMAGAYELQGGLEVEAKVGPNWADQKKLTAVRA